MVYQALIMVMMTNFLKNVNPKSCVCLERKGKDKNSLFGKRKEFAFWKQINKKTELCGH